MTTHVTITGTGTPLATHDRAGAGVLIRHDDTTCSSTRVEEPSQDFSGPSHHRHCSLRCFSPTITPTTSLGFKILS